MNYVDTGATAINTVALFIGWAILLLGGLALSACIAAALMTRVVERVLLIFDVYREFMAFALPRIWARAIARRERKAD